MKLYIRTDGNTTIGTGHVMRSLSIAKAARQGGHTCVFLIADTEMKTLLDQQGFQTIQLGSAWDDLDHELPRLLEVLGREKADLLLVDSYFATRSYLSALRKTVRLCYVDDLNSFTYPCDVLVNYNYYAEDMGYPAAYEGSGTSLLLGPRYAPLRDEFAGVPRRQTQPQVQDILLTSGGTDPFGAAELFARGLLGAGALEQARLHIVAGRFYARMSALEALQAQHPTRMVLHQNVENIAALMLQCDSAVSAAGSTLYELCACGLPTIVYAFADNQLLGKKKFSETLMCDAGDLRDGTEAVCKAVVDNMCHMASAPQEREQTARKMRALVDGKGAQRLVQALFD